MFFNRKKMSLLPQKSADNTDSAPIPAPVLSPAQADRISYAVDGYLQGHLLVATPLINGSCFQRSVIYLFAHNNEGAMGLIINQPLELVHFSSILDQANITIDGFEAAKRHISVYFGGPVDRSRGFLIHSSDYTNSETISNIANIAVTANTKVLRDIAEGSGPEKSILAVGYAGWSPGQLEAEIEQNSWNIVPATEDLVFGADNDLKWGKATQTLGFDINFYSSTVGHA